MAKQQRSSQILRAAERRHADHAMDRAMGIKQGSKLDNAIDRTMGVKDKPKRK